MYISIDFPRIDGLGVGRAWQIYIYIYTYKNTYVICVYIYVCVCVDCAAVFAALRIFN